MLRRVCDNSLSTAGNSWEVPFHATSFNPTAHHEEIHAGSYHLVDTDECSCAGDCTRAPLSSLFKAMMCLNLERVTLAMRTVPTPH